MLHTFFKYELFILLQNNSKFVRRQAGESFEFSDGHYLLISGMGAGPKPILHLAIVPMANDQLARDIRQKLGINIVSESVSQSGGGGGARIPRNKQQNDDEPPIYGLVSQDAEAAASASSLSRTSVAATVLLMMFFH